MSSSTAGRATQRFGFKQRGLRSNFVAARLDETENHAQQPGNLGNVGLWAMTSSTVILVRKLLEVVVGDVSSELPFKLFLEMSYAIGMRGSFTRSSRIARRSASSAGG
jgi:hypothetical protein